jgi:hypothetical protein
MNENIFVSHEIVNFEVYTIACYLKIHTNEIDANVFDINIHVIT